VKDPLCSGMQKAPGSGGFFRSQGLEEPVPSKAEGNLGPSGYELRFENSKLGASGEAFEPALRFEGPLNPTRCDLSQSRLLSEIRKIANSGEDQQASDN
jgi:hypothetical protein